MYHVYEPSKQTEYKPCLRYSFIDIIWSAVRHVRFKETTKTRLQQ